MRKLFLPDRSRFESKQALLETLHPISLKHTFHTYISELCIKGQPVGLFIKQPRSRIVIKIMKLNFS